MPQIERLKTIDMAVLEQLITGYVSDEQYVIARQGDDSLIQFTLQLVTLKTPYHKHYELDTSETYQSIVATGCSWVVLDGGQAIAIALAEPHLWNQSLWVHEFHVARAYHGRGIGRQLMESLIHDAQARQLRIIVCETQHTNVPAIRFYRKLGFQMDALDLSLYANDDDPEREIAIFMKRQLK